jgi:hypothetical protein
MRERITYSLLNHHDEKNPQECYINEEFRGASKTLARIIMKRVPKKHKYVILSQEKDNFPKILDVCSNTDSASDKVLEYALRYSHERISKEKTPLLTKSVVFNRTTYDEERYHRVKKRLKKK